ncbi:MAG: 3-hexulose-6-phosphate synthase [Chloroflexota bacterium]
MPRLQVAFDLLPIDQVVQLAPRLAPHVDVIEAGTPLIKRYGIEAVRRIREAVPDMPLVADMKTIDAGAYEAELALDAGADLVTVLGCASDATVSAMVAVARDRGKDVIADLLGVPDKVARARELARLGVASIGVHTGTDERTAGGAGPLRDAAAIRAAVPTPLVLAGGIDLCTIGDLLTLGPVVVGSAILNASDPVAAAAAFQQVIARHGQQQGEDGNQR